MAPTRRWRSTSPATALTSVWRSESEGRGTRRVAPPARQLPGRVRSPSGEEGSSNSTLARFAPTSSPCESAPLPPTSTWTTTSGWRPPRIASRPDASSTNRPICRRVSPSRLHAGRSRASVRYATKRPAASCQGWPSRPGFTSPRGCSGRVCSSRPRKRPRRRRSSPGASRTSRAGGVASRTTVASSRSTAATSTKASAGSSEKRQPSCSPSAE